MITFDVLTIFPGMFDALDYGVIKKAKQKGLIRVNVHDLREFTDDPHRSVDDTPYGGDGGMVMKLEPFHRAVSAISDNTKGVCVLLPTPRGEVLTQEKARDLAVCKRIMILCGHYEGVDERIRDLLSPRPVSIGDYVLTGGEIPAMVIVDAVSRHIPGVLGNMASAADDSFSEGILGFPQYTKPQEFMGLKVPDVLLSGNHKEIARWRREKALEITLMYRPELLQNAKITYKERQWLKSLKE